MGKPLSEFSLEELQAKEKTLQSFRNMGVIALILAIGGFAYLWISGAEMSPAMIAVFVAIVGGTMPSISGLAATKKEIAARNEGR